MLDDLLRALVEDVVRRVVREELAHAVTAPPRDHERDYISVRDAARLVGVSANTVRSWFADGLPQCRRGRVVRILRADLDRFLATKSAEPTDPNDYAAEILARRERR